MTRYTIEIERNRLGHFATNTLGTDALSAISSIPGTDKVELEKEGVDKVVVSYEWTGSKQFEVTYALSQHFCKQVDSQ